MPNHQRVTQRGTITRIIPAQSHGEAGYKKHNAAQDDDMERARAKVAQARKRGETWIEHHGIVMVLCRDEQYRPWDAVDPRQIGKPKCQKSKQ